MVELDKKDGNGEREGVSGSDRKGIWVPGSKAYMLPSLTSPQNSEHGKVPTSLGGQTLVEACLDQALWLTGRSKVTFARLAD